jgi:CRP-like cAMP-binding protein
VNFRLFAPFIRRFSLEPGAAAKLTGLAADQHPLRARDELFREGGRPGEVWFLAEGFAGRFKLLPEGRRAIIGFLLPGDLCGHQLELCAPFDHGVMALAPCLLAGVSPVAMDKAVREDAALGRALSCALAVEMAIQRQWLARMGCAADKRLAHLLCELRARLAMAGLADEEGFALPLIQQDLSEAAGISTVHVNRTLHHLRERGLIRIKDHNVLIPSLARLESFAEFSPAYLSPDRSAIRPVFHLSQMPRRDAAAQRQRSE